jgi:hypothetical protein
MMKLNHYLDMVETVANSEQNVLWTIDEILAATGGSLENSSVSDDVRGISMDSRTISAGEIFFAIKGDNFDGHSFVDDAIAAGARLAVVANQFQSGVSDMPLLRVGDPLEASFGCSSASTIFRPYYSRYWKCGKDRHQRRPYGLFER